MFSESFSSLVPFCSAPSTPMAFSSQYSILKHLSFFLSSPLPDDGLALCSEKLQPWRDFQTHTLRHYNVCCVCLTCSGVCLPQFLPWRSSLTSLKLILLLGCSSPCPFLLYKIHHSNTLSLLGTLNLNQHIRTFLTIYTSI